MDEEIKTKLIEWAQNIGNLAQEELPAFMREVAQYGFWASIFEATYLSLLCISMLYFIIKIMNDEETSRGLQGVFIFLILGVIFCTIGSVVEIRQAMMAYFAPKLYFIKQFR